MSGIIINLVFQGESPINATIIIRNSHAYFRL